MVEPMSDSIHPIFASVLFILAVFTVTRFTHLIRRDVLMQPFRDYVRDRAVRVDAANLLARTEQPAPAKGLLSYLKAKWHGFWPWLDDLISCPWCVGVWCSIPVAYVTVYFPTNRFVIGGMLACTASYVAGYVTERILHRDEASGDSP